MRRGHRHPFRRKVRSPQVRTHSFTAQPPDLHHLALITRASWFLAQSPCLAVPHIRFLFIGSQFMLRASFPHSVALMQLRLRFARRDQLATGLAPVGVSPCCAHKKKGLRQWLSSDPSASRSKVLIWRVFSSQLSRYDWQPHLLSLKPSLPDPRPL